MIWYYLRTIFSITIPTFYKGFQGRNLQRLKVKNPVLISMNHPNAFMDPIAFSTLLSSPRTYYLARGDAFKKGFISFFLESIGIVPIFRMQDAGIEGVKKNNASFKRVYKMLKDGKKIMVFSEGLCIQERRLRPIQKGTARMAFGFMDETGNKDLLIVPVGLNYSQPELFRSHLFYDVGEGIQVKDFYALYKENQAKGVNELTREIEKRMKALIPVLVDQSNDEVIEQLKDIYKDQWLKAQNLNENNLEHQQQYWYHIVDTLNKATTQQPGKLIVLKNTVLSYTKRLKALNLTDELIRCKGEQKDKKLSSLMLILLFPIYSLGKLLHFLPLWLSKKIADKTCKEIEFHSSVNIVTWSLLVQFHFLIELGIVWLLFHNWLALAGFALVKIVFGWGALKISPHIKRNIGFLRLNRLKQNNEANYTLLLQERNEIIETINYLTKQI